MQTIEVALAGFGTVGGGVYRLLTENAELIERRVDKRLHVKRVVCRNTKRVESLVGPDTSVGTSLEAVAEDPRVDVVVEVMGGIEPAKTFISAALKARKHVVTANKHLLAKHGLELFALAERQGVTLSYEASVAGGIPIIKALREGLAADRICSIAGIVNGTSNFILTTMKEQGASFANALCEAQRLGYAEADPTFDIEGVDAAHKMTLLAANAFGTVPRFDAAFVEGITQVDAADHRLAEHLGCCIKLLGSTRETPDGIELGVHPTLVSSLGSFAAVNGVLNGVLVDAEGLGSTFYSGRGAGALPTASAVVADLCDLSRVAVRPYGLGVPTASLRDAVYVSREKTRSGFYVRCRAVDLEAMSTCLRKVAIEVMKTTVDAEDAALITQEVAYGVLQEALRSAGCPFKVFFKSQF